MTTYPIKNTSDLVIEHPNGYTETYLYGNFELCVHSIFIRDNDYIRIDMGLFDVNNNSVIHMPYYWEFETAINQEPYDQVKANINLSELNGNIYKQFSFLSGTLDDYFEFN